MRAPVDGALPVVLNLAAPENGFAPIVGGFELEPNVKGINGAAGKEMADTAGSNDYVDANVIAAADRGIRAIDRSGNRAAFTCLTLWQGGLRFFPHGEGGGEFLLTQLVAGRCAPRSEEHTSELQSLRHLVCRLLLEKKNRARPRS